MENMTLTAEALQALVDLGKSASKNNDFRTYDQIVHRIIAGFAANRAAGIEIAMPVF